MTDSLLAITVLWGFVFIYSIMATMDFGAGFWSMVYINKEKTRATNIANRYLSPTWEVTNTFIVAIVVAVFSMFPTAAYTLGTVLLIPGSAILLLLAIRSAFLVFANIAHEYRKPLTYISGVSGMLIPGILLSVLPITHGGYVDFSSDKQSLDLVGLFTSWNEYAFFGFALSSTLFLSSLLLADYSNVSSEFEAYRVFRRDAIILGPISILMAVFTLFTLKQDANWIYQKMMDDFLMLSLSLLLFVIGSIALFLPSRKNKGIKGMPRLAIISITLQYLLASYVYGKAHLPFIVYPEVTITSAFTDPDSFHAIFATYIAGFIILFPGFYLFWKLFMHDKKYLQKETKK
ncbi:cytochrome d ubiquinol oxidase subunit II [Niallia sp. 01092]|uniref:cytochrome d ubiquinol oxidase subunit II n=1 Tax=unclassified Niallia TaxID=2837522 RepID=UPI003FD631F3